MRPPSSRKRLRALWRTIHLWLGLGLGLWLSLIGLTGSLLVFHHELREVLHPEWLAVEERPGGQAAFQPISAIVGAGTAVLPPGARWTFAYYPRNDSTAYWLDFDVPSRASGGRGSDRWYVFVDPYTTRILGKQLAQQGGRWLASDLIQLAFDLHYRLLLPWSVGIPLVGVAALLASVSILSGLYLWWPSPGRWRAALTLKRRASSARIVYDLHNLSGVYFLLILLPVLISGVYFNLPDEFFWVVRQFSPATQDRYRVRSHVPGTGRPPIGIGPAMALIRGRFPEGRPDWIYNAGAADATYTLCSSHVRSVSWFADRRCVVIDQYTGQTLQVTAPGVESGGNTFIAWQWPLHSGHALGLPGRMLVLFSGLAIPALFVTGLTRWLQKRSAAARTAVRRRSPAVHD